MAKRQYQRLRKREDELNPISPKNFQIQVPPALRRRGTNRGKVSVADRISIAYQAIVQYEKYADIAKAFRVGVP